MVFKGTAVAQGTGLAIVTATGMATQLGRVAGLLDTTVEPPTLLQTEVARIGRMLAIAVVVIAAVVVVAVWLASDIRSSADLVTIALLGVSLAVAAVPEGLPAILSVVLALGVQRIARRNAIVKKLSSVETLGSTSVICTDKTGTLTRAQMTIERVMTASGGTRVTGVGYAPDGQVQHKGAALGAGPLHSEHVVVLSGGSLAGRKAVHHHQRTSRLVGRIQRFEPSFDRRLVRRKACHQRLSVSRLRMLDGELETGQPHHVVRVAATAELQGTVGQPLQHAPELTVGAGVGADAADVVHTGGERPALPLEGLRQPAGHAVLFEHQHALAATRQGGGRRQAADARTQNDGVPHV